MDYGSLVFISKKTGIKFAKKSTFQGSQRQVRGHIIKYLTKHGKVSIDDAKKLFVHEAFDSIIEKMVTEGLIIVQNGEILL